jgi:hypothetical protein
MDFDSFPEDTEEICVSNKGLTSLDVTRFKNLKILYCENNKLTSLQLNENLQELHCCHNKLTCLHLNKNLEYLSCYNNKLTCLHLNENLHTLYCISNPISEILYDHMSKILDHIGIIKKLRVLNQFRDLYYCLKFKKRFRDLLWVKIREPKIREKYSHDYLVKNLHEETDLDELLENW